jgi:hypothetical protein
MFKAVGRGIVITSIVVWVRVSQWMVHFEATWKVQGQTLVVG